MRIQLKIGFEIHCQNIFIVQNARKAAYKSTGNAAATRQSFQTARPVYNSHKITAPMPIKINAAFCVNIKAAKNSKRTEQAH